MKIFELIPTGSRKSFYGKAKVIESNSEEVTVSKLISYETVVAEYHHKDNYMYIHSCPSNTTARHINAFLELYGFDECTKQELLTYNK